MPNIKVATDYASRADIVIIIGTSLNVYPAQDCSTMQNLIDLAEVKVPYDRYVHVIQKGASEGMHELSRLLGV